MPVERKRRCSLYQSADFGTGEVLGELRQLIDIDVTFDDVVVAHLRCVDLEDLCSASLIGKRNLHMNFQTTGTQKSFIDHVHSVGHTNEEDIVQLVNTIQFREQLVDDAVANTGATTAGTSLFAHSVKFVEDDNVETALITLLLVFLLCIGEEFSDVLLRLTNVFVQHLGSVDDFGLPSIQHLTDLTRDKGLSGSGWAVKKDTSHMLNTKLLYKPGWENAGSKGSSEDGAELGIQTTNAHVFELEAGLDDGIGGRTPTGSLDLDVGTCVFEEVDLGVTRENAPRARVCERSCRGGICLLHGKIDQRHGSDRQSEDDAFDVHEELLARRKDLVFKVLRVL